MKTLAADTQWLTHASFAPIARYSGWLRWSLGVAAVILLLVAAGLGPLGDMFATAGELAAAQQEQAQLTAEVDRLRMQLVVQDETRGQLEQHTAELNAQVEELTRQLEFLTARKRNGARPN